MSLLAIGTVAIDTIKTPHDVADNVIGGAATYASWAASYLTTPIHIVSIIGGDFPKEELQALEARGVNTSGIEIVEDGKSFFWAGRYHKNMISRDTLVTQLNVLADFNPVIGEAQQEAEYLMLGNLVPDIQMSVIRQMKRRPKLIALDTMNFWMDNALESLIEVIKEVDVLIINDEEARQLSGEFSLVRAANKILEMGPRYLVIKKGEHGALLFGEERIFFAPGLPLLEVIDPTGAGDTFAGGFMGHIARTGDTSFENMRRAIVYGSVMASFCVESFGPDKLKTLTDDDIINRYQEFKELVRFD